MEHAPLPSWVYIDDTRWPEVRCTFLDTPLDAVFGARHERLASYLRREERHADILDLQAAELPPPRSRAAFVQGLKEHEFPIGNFVAGVALVLPAATLPFARSTMILARSALVPCTVLDSVEAARWWCEEQMARKTPSDGAAHAPRTTAKAHR